MFITELSKRKVLCLIFVVFLLYMLINGKCRLIIKDNTVIKVQDGIFQKRKNITSIEIPSGVTRIGSMAFMGCDELKELKIPDSVLCIGSLAFWRCTNLQSIEIPDLVAEIGPRAFSGCEKLVRIKLPEELPEIE